MHFTFYSCVPWRDDDTVGVGLSVLYRLLFCQGANWISFSFNLLLLYMFYSFSAVMLVMFFYNLHIMSGGCVVRCVHAMLFFICLCKAL